MKTAAFASRNLKEILRDKLNICFGLGFPLVVLGLLTLIQSNIPVPLFLLDQLTPGILVFGLSFISLFSAQLIAKDRGSSLMLRLLISPMRASQFILGYLLPLLPVAICQMIVCLAAAALLGLPVSVHYMGLLAASLPAAVLFIAIGLLCGSLLNDRQAGGVCGAFLTNLSAWLSGTWFSLELVGGGFKTAAEFLPFARAVNAGRLALAGNYSALPAQLIWVIGWAAVMLAFAVAAFTRRMHGDGK